MKFNYLSVKILIITMFLAIISGCGENPIDQIQNFLPNKPPVINDFTSDYDGRSIVPSLRLNLTLDAQDPEGSPIDIKFTSDQGTFTNMSTNGGITTIAFIVGSIGPGEVVEVTATVSDNKKASASKTLPIGTTNVGLNIEFLEGIPAVIKSDDSVTVKFITDSPGFYQLRIIDNPDQIPVFSYTDPCYFIDEEGVVEREIFGPGLSGMPRLNDEVSSPDRVWIITQDLLGQGASFSFLISVDGSPPVTTPSPVSGGYSTQQNLQLNCADPGSGCSGISYTIDGSEPDFSGSGTVVSGDVASISLNRGIHQIKFTSRDNFNYIEAVKTINYTIGHTITYNGNGNSGGSVPTAAGWFLQGETLSASANTELLSKTGYNFSHWNTNSNGSGISYYTGDTITIAASNLILYAVWQTGGKVIYDGNGSTGGTVPVNATTYTAGTSVEIAGNSGGLSKTGHIFSKWNTQENGSGTDYNPSDLLIIGETNVILYAIWTPVYTVTYYGNVETSGDVPVDGINYISGQPVTVKDNSGGLIKAGYIFSCWNTQANGNGTDYNPGNSFNIGSADVVLYAKWIEGKSVVYHGNTNTGGTPPSDPGLYPAGADVSVRGNTGGLTKTNYSFLCWNTQADGSGQNYIPGDILTMGTTHVNLYAVWRFNTGSVKTFSFDGKTIRMVGVRGGYTFPYLSNDSDVRTVNRSYWIDESDVTYALWSAVYNWAIANGYTFQNPGRMGGTYNDNATDQHPATNMNWRDAIVWLNALTEYYNANNGALEDLDCVYYTDENYTVPIRSSLSGSYTSSANPNPGSFDLPYIKAAATGNLSMDNITANGFRLTTLNEFLLAARYRGTDTTNTVNTVIAGINFAEPPDGIYWTKGDSASGAAGPSVALGGDNSATDAVAWWQNNSYVGAPINNRTTHPVKTKNPNTLGLYDMSGNIYKLVFDINIGTSRRRISCEALWATDASVRVNFMTGFQPYIINTGTGFRIGRSE